MTYKYSSQKSFSPTGYPVMLCFFLSLDLTDRNIQVKFGLKRVLEFSDEDIL